MQYIWHLSSLVAKRWSCAQFEINKLECWGYRNWNETVDIFFFWCLNRIGDPRWTILRFRSRSWHPGPGVFDRDAPVDSLTCWNYYFQKWLNMSNSCQCVTKLSEDEFASHVYWDSQDLKATPWKDLRSDLCEILTLKARFMTSSNLLSFGMKLTQKCSQFGSLDDLHWFFSAKRPFRQVKPRLASLEKEVTWSNFSSHQLSHGHDKQLRRVKRAVACFQCPPAVWLVRPKWVTLDPVLAYGVCVDKNEWKI